MNNAFLNLSHQSKAIIFQNFQENEPIFSINRDFRDFFYKKLQNETDKKIGLYQKNLLLEGFSLIQKKPKLQNQIKEATEYWKEAIVPLLQDSLINPKGQSAKILDSMVKSSNKKMVQFDKLGQRKKKLEEINLQLKNLLQMRENEKNFYNLCGGKSFYLLAKHHYGNYTNWTHVKCEEKNLGKLIAFTKDSFANFWYVNSRVAEGILRLDAYKEVYNNNKKPIKHYIGVSLMYTDDGLPMIGIKEKADQWRYLVQFSDKCPNRFEIWDVKFLKEEL